GIIKTLTSEGGWEGSDIAEVFTEIDKEVRAKVPKSPDTVTKSDDVSNSHQTKTSNSTVAVETGSKQTDTKNVTVDESDLNHESVSESDSSKEENPTEDTKTGGGNHTMVVIVGLLIILGIVGGSVYAFFALKESPITPYEVLMMSSANYADATSIKTDGSFLMGGVFKTQDQNNSQYSGFEMPLQEISGSYGMKYVIQYTTEKENPLAEGEFDIHVDGKYSFFNIDFDAKIAFRVVDNFVYVKFDDMTQLPIPVDLSLIQGEWIEIDLNKFLEASGTTLEEALAVNKEQEEKALRVFKEVLEDSDIIEFINTHFVSVEDEEEISGDNYHYRVKLTARELEKLFIEVAVSLRENEEFLTLIPDIAGWDKDTTEEEHRD
ncbi:MAG: hypothetical protein KAR20_28900, partial [Candidatus Heimdallarchaeota archaeon]|nr:hypothetical protein [Candidatus Heimdallarchaeota archaeon]